MTLSSQLFLYFRKVDHRVKHRIQHTAIFIFTRSEQVEAKKKILTRRCAQTNQSIIRHLNQKTEEIAFSTGLPVLMMNGNTNQRESFGDKLENAFNLVFAAGYQNVIAIGNDCPNLTKETLLFAADQLKKNEYVLGPAQDGGVYLLGIRNDAVAHFSFQQLPWSTGHLYNAILDHIPDTTHHILAVERDIDHAKDLVDFLKTPGKSLFKQKITQLLIAGIGQISDLVKLIFSFPFFISHSQRGPPVSFVNSIIL